MRKALEGRPQPEFAAPPGIVHVRIDPDTGKPTPDGARGPFKQGTEPTAVPEERRRVEVQDCSCSRATRGRP